ncbi:polymer-forming cytoskeletal protein [Paenibacillus turpanensis]|uniref:bactofilin family protein n=1 Tax=Paenibacillus turpanensis TaxID=2689078 RepID=UPI003132D7E1
MFGKKKNPVNPNSTDTLIGEGTIVEGKMLSEASLRIEGKVIGDIECCGDVMIGEKGEVHSNLQARNVINAGIIVGSVTTKGKLTITNKGRVSGEIDVGLLQIAEGGILQGASRMTPEQTRQVESESLKPVKGNRSSKPVKAEGEKEKANAS